MSERERERERELWRERERLRERERVFGVLFSVTAGEKEYFNKCERM